MASLSGLNTKVLSKDDAEPALSPNTLRIYNMRFCPWAERVILWASLQNIPAEVVNIDLQDKPSWYVTKTETGKVPATQYNNQVVIESGIIPEYLDGLFPDKALIPSDPYTRAQHRIIAEKLSPASTILYGLVAVIKNKLEGKEREEKEEPVFKFFDSAEKLLEKDFFAGSSPGLPDLFSLPFFERLNVVFTVLSSAGVDVESFPGSSRWPRLTAWFSRITSLPPIKAVIHSKQNLITFSTAFLSGAKPDYDLGI